MAAEGKTDLVTRMIRAAQLDVLLYEEVEADESASGQAALVVLLTGMAGGLGSALSRAEGHHSAALIGGMIIGGIAALVGWVLWALLTYWIGTRLFAGTATPGEMLRTLGFAQAPGLLNALAFFPILGWVIQVVAWGWILVAGVIAVRQALDFSTEKAILTVLIGWVVELVLWFLFASFLLMSLVALFVGAAALGGAGR